MNLIMIQTRKMIKQNSMKNNKLKIKIWQLINKDNN